MFNARKLLSKEFYLPAWLVEHWQDDYVANLIKSHDDLGAFERVSDREVWWALLVLRWKRVVAPYLRIFKLAWEVIRGHYWRTAKKVDSGANQASGSGAGTPGVTATFTITGAGYAAYSGGGTSTPGTSASVAAPVFQDAGIKAGEVTAYRAWTLCSDGLLHSAVIDFIWQPDTPAEGNPSATNGEGIYAYKSILDVPNYADGERSASVTGQVELWGDVYEHQIGYRAQYAAISWIDDSPYYDAAALRKKYGLTKKRGSKKK